MKATPQAQRRLLDLAGLDAERVRLQAQAKAMPEQRALRDLETARAEHRAWVARQTGEVEELQAQQGRAESDARLVEERLARDEERMQHSASAKEITGFEHEIEALKRRRGHLEDAQLSIMEQLERAQAELDRAIQAQRAVEAEAEELIIKRDAKRESLRAEARVNSAARTQLVQQIDAELLALYEKQRERYGIGAAELVGEITSGSNVRLDPVDLQRILAAGEDEVVLCPDSGAILIRTERSATR